MQQVFFASAYVPVELIRAHGLAPVRTARGGGAERGPVPDAAGICAFMRACVNEACAAPQAAALIATSECDQMRRGGELAARQSPLPIFLFDVPTRSQDREVEDWFAAELRRLGDFLAELVGAAPTREQLWQAIGERERDWESSTRAHRADAGLPLALLGGHLSETDEGVLREIERCGGRIVLDATDLGARGRPAAPGGEARGDPYAELARAYLGAIPGVFQRPNGRLFEWLCEAVQRSGVRAAVLVRHVWCDLWHAEVPRLQEALGLPVLDLDLAAEGADQRNRTRIQALLETLGAAP